MSAEADALAARLLDARTRLVHEGPVGAAKALEGLDGLIAAAVRAAPTPGALRQVRGALAALEQVAAEVSVELRRSLLQGAAGARAEKAYRAG